MLDLIKFEADKLNLLSNMENLSAGEGICL